LECHPSIINAAQIIFQKINIDMFLASKTMECALKKLKLMRSEKYYTDLIIRAKENWEKMGLLDNEFPETRIRRVKSMAGEVARDIGHSAREKHRSGYFQACDNMINELEIRTTNFTSLHKLFDFLQPSKLKDITNDELDIHTRNLISKYKCFSTDLKLDIRTFIDCYFVDGVQCHENNEHSVYTYLKFITDLKLEDSIKEMQLLCRIFLTLPISTVSAERSMSSLKKIKDYRRSTLSEDRLNDYAMLYIERDTAELIDLQSTIKIFSEKKARKGYKSELL